MRQAKLKAKWNDFLTKEKERKRKWRTELKKDQERHASYKGDGKLRKWAAKKKRRGQKISRSGMLRKFLILFTFKRSQVNHLQNLSLCIFEQAVFPPEPLKS